MRGIFFEYIYNEMKDDQGVSGGDEGVGGLMKRLMILLTINSKPWKIKDACF